MKALLLLLVVFFLSADFVRAQSSAEQKSGRLPTGEAYRVDRDGFQLVDQLAELEVTNHDLQRQINALEDELREKSQTIERLKAGSNTGVGVIVETELVKPAAPRGESALSKPSNNQVLTTRKEQQLRSELQRLKSDLAESQRRLQEVEHREQRSVARDQSECQSQLLAQKASLQGEVGSCLSELQASKLRVSGLTEEVIELEKKVQIHVAQAGSLLGEKQKVQAVEREVARYRERLSNADQQVAQLKIEFEQLRDKYSSVDRELRLALSENGRASSLQLDLEKSQMELAERQKQLAKLTQENEKLVKQNEQNKILLSRVSADSKSVSAQSPSAASYTRASLSSSPVVASVGGESVKKISSSLANIQSLIGKRKNLYDQLRGRSSAVSVSVQPLVAKNGESLDQIRLRAKSAKSDDDARNIIAQLEGIEKILNEDISLISRLANL